MSLKKISRYLTREKFEWLLKDKGIFIAPASAQSDPDEGRFNSKSIVEAIHTYAVELNSGKNLMDDNFKLDLIKIFDNCNKHEQTVSYLSSWFLDENESHKMWNEYAKDESGTLGVSLVSSTDIIIMNLPKPLMHATEFEETVYDNLKKKYAFINSYKYKNEKFKDEKEFRLIFDLTQYSLITGYESGAITAIKIGNDLVPFHEHLNSSGRYFPNEEDKKKIYTALERKGNGFILKFDLNKIISEIRLHPNSTLEDQVYIENLVREAGYDFKVLPSSLLI
ncbi:hypothetical protein [Pseudoalteromonas gelatinilytica]